MLANHSQEWEFDLQLFAEEEAAEEDVAEDEVIPTEEGDEHAEDEFDEIVYNKETVRIPKKERTTYLQKGYNYDKVQTKAKEYEAALEKAARLSGFEDVDAYLKAVDDAEKKEEAKRYQQAGVNDPKVIEEIVDKHPAVKEAKRIADQQKLNSEVAELAKEFKETFGREMTQEDITDEVLNHRHSKGVTMVEAFFFVNRKGLKAMLDKEKEAAAKKALSDHKRQAARGVESSDESPSEEKGLDFTAEEKEWAERRVAKGHYKNKKEAWEWLRGKRK